MGNAFDLHENELASKTARAFSYKRFYTTFYINYILVATKLKIAHHLFPHVHISAYLTYRQNVTNLIRLVPGRYLSG